MRGSLTSFVPLALAVSAAPSDKRETSNAIPLTKSSKISKDGVVNIKALRNHVTKIQGKYTASLARFEKNVGKAHPNARIGTITKRQTGSDPLKDADSELWYGPISVGGKDFTVDFDTGSSDLFLPGPDCGETCKGHTVYDHSGGEDAGETFQLRYGDGSTVQGEVFTDKVTVAGLTADPQALGAAKEYSSGFSSDHFPADGLMGMAYPEIAQISATAPFFNTLISQESVDSGSFGFKLAPSGSVLYLGGVDSASSSGDLNTVPVTQKGYWQVDMDSAEVNGKPAVQGLSAIIDTGTTLVVGDPSQVADFYKAVDGAQDASSTVGEGFFTFPCDSAPKVSMSFGGKSYDISKTFSLGAVEEGSSDCVGGIVGQDVGIDAWIAGDVFLANVYAQFNFDDNTVGFSAQA